MAKIESFLGLFYFAEEQKRANGSLPLLLVEVTGSPFLVSRVWVVQTS